MLEQVLDARPRPIDGFDVRRLLPAIERRLVGPVVFFDHFGPATLAPGQGFDVRPHPHINLATVTYLFEGGIFHRDSLGCQQLITPGAINWMTAGRGIVHSERTPPELRRTGSDMHGIQMWVALPREVEESEPGFFHHPADTLPALEVEGTPVRLLVGSGWGARSPVGVLSPTIYAEARLAPGGRLPLPPDHEQRAVYVVDGDVTCLQTPATRGRLLIFAPGDTVVLQAGPVGAHVMILGGARLDGTRHVWWNFVSSRPERIAQAKSDWRAGRFPRIPGDDREFIPLPES